MTTVDTSTASIADVRSTRRQVIPPLGIAGVAALAALTPIGQVRAQGTSGGGPSRFVYVGTYTAPNTAPGGLKPSVSRGVYVFKMDSRTGGLTPVQVVELANPSWVVVHPTNRFLFASSEINVGTVTAFSISPTDGTLTKLNEQSSGGAIPASMTIDPSGKFLLVANYVGAPPKGTFAVLAIGGDGQLSAPTVYEVNGSGPDASRQEAPHAHDIKFDPSGTYVHGVDLGTDTIWSWGFDSVGGRLRSGNLSHGGQVASGSGPRHLSFSTKGPWAYAIDEMVSSVTAFKYDGSKGTFIWNQTVSTLPPDFNGSSSTAEIIVHPNGQWVYGSNRGHDSIVVYAIDQQSGKLNPVQWRSTEGKVPRGFNIDPTGTLLLAGNQNSDTIVPFAIDPASGQLSSTGAVTNTPTPVCIQFGALVP